MMSKHGPQRIGDSKWRFRVWAPEIPLMTLRMLTPFDTRYNMRKDEAGYFNFECEGITDTADYFFQPNGLHDLPDPASHFQPDGVHGCSRLVDHDAFEWHDQAWRGIPWKDFIIYEMHTGTFSAEGTFDGVIQCLDELVDLGINAIELMPVAQFPGERNWGYDGVFPYAVQNNYGGPDGLKRLVDACHTKGIAVVLDVVYNHIGPEGNYFPQFGPYFTDAHRVPWGDAVNFDQEWSDAVRDYFLDNVSYWVENYHVDALRLDAIHFMFDSNPEHIMMAIARRAEELSESTGRPVYLVAESDLNDAKVVHHASIGGFGMRAQWLDDFHHALYALIAPDGKERYEDFGTVMQLAKALNDGFVHSGEYVKFRKRIFGGSSAGINGDRFVVFNQNHDQVGNRMLGERLNTLIDVPLMRIAAAVTILSPYIPLLFMGEEYAEDSPFLYFVDHSDAQLIDAVREGRKKDFAAFGGDAEAVDPQEENTFLRSKLHWIQRVKDHHGEMLAWYRALIRLRKEHKVFRSYEKRLVHASVIDPLSLAVHRQALNTDEEILIFLNFSSDAVPYTFPGNAWRCLLNSTAFPSGDTAGVVQGAKSSSVMLPPRSVCVYESNNVGD